MCTHGYPWLPLCYQFSSYATAAIAMVDDKMGGIYADGVNIRTRYETAFSLIAIEAYSGATHAS